MLTWEDDVEVHALRKRGWTIAAIARHTRLGPQDGAGLSVGEAKPGGAGAAGSGSVRAVR